MKHEAMGKNSSCNSIPKRNAQGILILLIQKLRAFLRHSSDAFTERCHAEQPATYSAAAQNSGVQLVAFCFEYCDFAVKHFRLYYYLVS